MKKVAKGNCVAVVFVDESIVHLEGVRPEDLITATHVAVRLEDEDDSHIMVSLSPITKEIREVLKASVLAINGVISKIQNLTEKAQLALKEPGNELRVLLLCLSLERELHAFLEKIYQTTGTAVLSIQKSYTEIPVERIPKINPFKKGS